MSAADTEDFFYKGRITGMAYDGGISIFNYIGATDRIADVQRTPNITRTPEILDQSPNLSPMELAQAFDFYEIVLHNGEYFVWGRKNHLGCLGMRNEPTGLK